MSTATIPGAAAGAHVGNGRAKMPPHNPDVEMRLLGSILRDPSVLDDPVVASVRPGDVYVGVHGTLFGQRGEIIREHPGADVVDVTTWAEDALREVAGMDRGDAGALISVALDRAPSATCAPSDAAVVIEKAGARQLIDAAAR